MRHRQRGRRLGRNASHRKAMFRNMACSLICSSSPDEDAPNAPRVPGRIVTTVAKAKELRPFVEKLVTLARKAIDHEENAAGLASKAERNSDEWRRWRNSEQWNEWNQAIAPAVAYRRRAFAILRDRNAVSILFDELAHRFADRPGGYTRIVQLAQKRLGDSGVQALIEFVGERDRVKSKRRAPLAIDDQPEEDASTAPVEDASESQVADDARATETSAADVESAGDDAAGTEEKSTEA